MRLPKHPALAYLFLVRPMRLFALLAIALAGSVDAAQVREYRYTHGEVAAQITHFIKPDYPYEAQRMRQRGQGYYRLYVARDGSVTAVKIIWSTGYHLLDVACLKALKGWRLKPGFRREIDLPVSFVIHESGAYPSAAYVEPRPTIVREFRD